MHTPTGMGGAGQGYLYKYPSQTSIHSMVSMGYMPPGHGYLPKKPKPDKPYGPSFVSVMNRTWRGPGRKYINYSLVFLCLGILFLSSGALYFGHRTVSRLTVLRTEALGALLVVVGILCIGAVFQLINKAREESNRWRACVRFRSQGLFTAAAVNNAYVPEENVKLASGTYGPRALKEVPRPSRSKGARGRSTGNLPRATGAPSGPPPAASSQTRLFEKRGQHKPSPLAAEDSGVMNTVPEALEPVEAEAAMERRVGYQPPSTSSSLARSGELEETDRSGAYEESYHGASTLPLGPARPSPVPFGVSKPPQDQPRASPAAMPPQGLPRPQPLPPVRRPPPPQVHRPSPQEWRTGAASPSPTPVQQPQRSMSPQVLPPVQRAPVSTMRSPPQPTIQLGGMKHSTSESEL